MTKNKKGFTLIELVVVMAIIAVLAALMVTAIVAARKQSVSTAIVGDAKAIEVGLETYSSAKDGLYPGVAAGVVTGTGALNATLVTTYLSSAPTRSANVFYYPSAVTGTASKYTLVACPDGTTATAITVGSAGSSATKTGVCSGTTDALYVTIR
jgi:prepilin-type N-terminal cleavage/methylation domain-containing protein